MNQKDLYECFTNFSCSLFLNLSIAMSQSLDLSIAMSQSFDLSIAMSQSLDLLSNLYVFWGKEDYCKLGR